MEIDTRLLMDILSIDSTSGRERALADYLAERLPVGGCTVRRIPEDAGEGEPYNLLLTWGEPTVVLCTHMDTVPPYIAPTMSTDSTGTTIISGRGSCDAKGQLVAMYAACKALAEAGESGYGLLLVYGEETGSYGAKQMQGCGGAPYLIVGEPTDNAMVRASKGTKSYGLTITGHSFHSGYPHYGTSAIETFVDIVNGLRQFTLGLPIDPVLGATTYNIGELESDNPQNILSGKLTCRVYYRTTFATDQTVSQYMQSLSGDNVRVKAYGGDTPSHYMTLPGIPVTTVAFGSDAPHLSEYRHKMIYGAGSILVAHTPQEHIRLPELEKAADNYRRMVIDIKYIKDKTE